MRTLFRRGVCLLLLLGTGGAAADWSNPEPFRRDRVEGREFDYNAESFLHRFSFEPKPALGRGSPLPRDGLFGLAGSSRSNELYVDMRAQATLETESPLFFGYRFHRTEDFDGRYDENLVGFGAHVGPFRVSVWGDVVGAKEDIDIHGELLWLPSAGNHLRFTLVAPDAVYNSKQGEGEYLRKPYTYYLDGQWQVLDDLRLYGFINHNDHMRWRENTREFTLRDRQHSAGVGVDLRLNRYWSASVELEGLYGVRRRDGLAGPDEADQRLRRSFGLATVELRQWLRDDLQAWYGARYLHFDETDRRPRDAEEHVRYERRETMVYGGVRYRWTDAVSFAPGIFVNYADNTERYPDVPGESDSDRGIYAKLTPSVELLVDRRRGGYITLNPSVRLHRAAFGGGNIQAYLPF
ncbi:MAG: hypothetical protein JJU06_20830 [Ectothiorhodospiraceae bacterium]|nr:hypothetical protein [Ectothiorhodospiraceae bacterium]